MSERRIFLVDDDAEFCQHVKELLADMADVEFFTQPLPFLKAVIKEKPDLVLIDLNLNHTKWNGFKLISELKQEQDSHLVPMVMLSGADSSDILEKAFRSGIEDYLMKPILPAHFRRKVEHLLFNTHQKIHLNALTGLPGIGLIEREFDQRAEKDMPFSVAYLDLDNFKPFNDSKGVKAGDEVIKGLASILIDVRKAYEKSELFVGHLGGDDFFLVGNKSKIKQAVKKSYKHFEEYVRTLYTSEEINNNCYVSTSRDQVQQKFPLLAVSTALIHLPASAHCNFQLVAEASTDIKKRAKQIKGNSIAELTLNVPTASKKQQELKQLKQRPSRQKDAG